MRCAARSAAARPGTGSSARSARQKRLPLGRPLRLAYADPPYPGKAYLYRDHPDYGGEVDHAELIERLAAYDGWALSTSAAALPLTRPVPARRPGGGLAEGERVTCSRFPLSAWEPVLYHGGRQLPGQRRADSIACGVTPVSTVPGHVIGAKPAAVCRWIFALLGAGPGDILDDLYPGSGAVSRAWAAYTSPGPSRHGYPSCQARAEASSPAAGDGSDPSSGPSCDGSLLLLEFTP